MLTSLSFSLPSTQIPVVQPPEPIETGTSSSSTSTAANTAAGDAQSSTSSNTITLTIKSLKPPLSFSLPCSLTADVASLKAQLHAQEAAKGAPEPERQRWLYKGKAMADERILKEYDGIKDGETVHLSIKAGVVAPTATAATTTTTTPSSTIATSAISPMPSPLPPADFAAPAPPKDTLSASPSPFGFQSQAMSPTSGAGSPTASKRRARTSSQLSSATNHSRVPSITLTTDFSNFDNLAGNSTSPIDANMNPGVPLASTPELSTSGISSPPFSPGQSGSAGAGRASGASTPRSAPGTPYSGGGGRGRTPSISIPIDLDNLDLMNPVSSDRKLPVGLSPALVKTIREPGTWSDLLDFLENKITSAQAAVAEGKATGRESPSPRVPQQPMKEYSEETIRVFENWLGASKDWMNASDIARIRDSTGIFGMGGR